MKFRIGILLLLLMLFVMITVVLAQDQAPTATPDPAAAQPSMGQMDMSSMSTDEPISGTMCDVDTFVAQQQAYANGLTAFAQIYQADPEAALLLAYNVGLTYQTFALSCGFVPPVAADHDHAAEDIAHDDHSEEAHMELVLSLGDPENGLTLFTTVQTQTGFACATCHRVDSTETLIGPGLVNIGNPAHDPSAHQHGGDASMTMPMPTEEATHVERTMDEVVTYIRTSILQPSDFIVPGFPDLLMPQIYAQVFSDQEVNDLIAYLLTLHE